MNRISFLFAVLLLTLGVSAQQKVCKTVFIIVDGIAADVIESQPVPNLKSIAAKGHYFRAWLGGEKGGYSQTPTISAVGYNSLLTGTWANKHNVWDNDIAAPNYNYPTIFRLMKDQYPQKKTGVYSSWLDNRTKLVGDGLAATGNIKVDFVADGYELDTVQFPHDSQDDYMEKIDRKVAEQAAEIISKHAPDMNWVYMQYTDDMGHMFGDQPQYARAIRLMDEKVGLVWKAIQEREKKFGEEWLIFVTTDHGRDAATGKGHGGQSYRERNIWMVTNQPAVGNYASFFKPAITDIYPSIASFMKIRMPVEIARELDGQSIFSQGSITNMQVNYFQGKIDVSWTPLVKNQQVRILVSTSNNVKTGGKDEYFEVGKADISKGAAIVDVSKYPSELYKVVLEAPGTTLNRWAINKAPVPAPASAQLLPGGPAWGALWQQSAAEYKALAYQSYQTAKARLDQLLAARPSGKPLAVITDIDETVLDNSPYFIQQALNKKMYDDSSWIRWTSQQKCDTVPGALNFFRYAATKGVEVFYITNRFEVERAATLANLQKFGFPNTTDDHLFLLNTENSSKEVRRNAIEAKFEVLLLIGDHLGDFNRLFDTKVEGERSQAVNKAAALFGNRFIALPNCMYGGWEDALFYQKPGTETVAAKDALLVKRLKEIVK
ncbi:5'-nucleotidase, lipoprotein e(P4) family [Flavihumibacter solisilvae]|uniref:5'-nucleotidase, lipoprotein e(P4) family n=1 Tax=Flavihumibacter solisilvae TaxID=1349421 RepID=UPI000907B115|nr:5'-nucleotidase, lipoprotein e(P4) family [Flavihumibacter solisilvae]